MSTKKNYFSITAGIVAVLTIVYFFYEFFRIINLSNRLDISLGASFFVLNIIMVLSMGLCAVFSFVFYGKKSNLFLGLSALLIVVYHSYGAIDFFETFRIVMRWGDTDSLVWALSVLISSILLALFFILIALKYFTDKIKLKIKIIPIIALAVAILTNIILLLISGYVVNLNYILQSIFNWFYIVPFFLFAWFCPLTNPKPNENNTISIFKKQEIKIIDLNEQLLYLKNEFESGRITQQDYDYKRKGLVDSL